jgi:hypothetical protein
VKTIDGANSSFLRVFLSLPGQSVLNPNRGFAIDGAPDSLLLFLGKTHVVLQKNKL